MALSRMTLEDEIQRIQNKLTYVRPLPPHSRELLDETLQKATEKLAQLDSSHTPKNNS